MPTLLIWTQSLKQPDSNRLVPIYTYNSYTGKNFVYYWTHTHWSMGSMYIFIRTSIQFFIVHFHDLIDNILTEIFLSCFVFLPFMNAIIHFKYIIISTYYGQIWLFIWMYIFWFLDIIRLKLTHSVNGKLYTLVPKLFR